MDLVYLSYGYSPIPHQVLVFGKILKTNSYKYFIVNISYFIMPDAFILTLVLLSDVLSA